MPICLFDFACIQIGDNEILAISSRRTYRIFLETGECICTINFRINTNIDPVIKGEYVFSLTDDYQLVRYSLAKDCWNPLTRTGCCEIC